MELISMRNLLVHDYDGINLNIAWETVNDDLPRLRGKVLAVLAALGRDVNPDVLYFQ